MKKLIILISIILLSACQSTPEKNLEPIIKKEFVYIKCKVDEKILTTNKITISEKDNISEVIKKLIEELNSRKDKLESIKNINCIEVK